MSDGKSAAPRAAVAHASPEPAVDETSEPQTEASVDGAPAVPDHWVAIGAPMVGTFYRAPKPGEPPFVEAGRRVAAGAHRRARRGDEAVHRTQGRGDRQGRANRRRRRLSGGVRPAAVSGSNRHERPSGSRYVDVTTRDGHQSLWATRMTNAMILPIAEQMDRVGFDWINLEGGAVFDVCVRFLHEDPWERMRLVAERVQTHADRHHDPRPEPVHVPVLRRRRRRADDPPNPRQRHAPHHRLRRAERHPQPRAVRTGRQARRACTSAPASSTRSRRCTPTSTTSRSPASWSHLGADTVMIKDPSGLLLPDRVRTLVPALKRCRRVPLELHSHSLSGMAEPCYLEAAPPRHRHPAHRVASRWPVALRCRRPSTARGTWRGRDSSTSRLDRDGLAAMTDYFTGVAHRHGFPLAAPNWLRPDSVPAPGARRHDLQPAHGPGADGHGGRASRRSSKRPNRSASTSATRSWSARSPST